MDTLLTILFFVAAAIISALVKKKQANQEGSDSWGGDMTPPPRSQGKGQTAGRSNWEEELRRLLQGETQSPPVQPPLPPPRRVVVSEPTRPGPPPPLPAQSTVTVTVPYGAPLHKMAPPPAGQQVTRENLAQSKGAYDRASRLQTRAADRLKRAGEGIRTHKKAVVLKEGPLEAKQAVGWLQSPQTLRSALIASVILGPPKSMEK
jgi:hypothetical protein